MSSELFLQLFALLTALIASQGFWAFLNHKLTRTSKFERALKALVHDKISYLSQKAIKAGEVSASDYRIMMELYEAYKDIGGNGTVTKLMLEVEKLEIKIEKE